MLATELKPKQRLGYSRSKSTIPAEIPYTVCDNFTSVLNPQMHTLRILGVQKRKWTPSIFFVGGESDSVLDCCYFQLSILEPNGSLV